MKFTQRLVVSALFLVFLETSFQIPPVLATLQFHRLKHAKLRSIFSDNQFLYNFFNQLLVDDGRSVFGGVTPIPVNESRKSNFRNVSKSPESSVSRTSLSFSETLTNSVSPTQISYHCSSPDIPSNGVIIPEDDQTWEVGSLHNVTCLVNPETGITYRDIFISLGFNQPPVPHQVIDDFTIRATLNASQPGSYKLLCMSNATGIPSLLCMRSVSVGYPPLDVQDLQCVSWNWHSLECNWSIPENPAQAPSEDYLVYLVTDIKEHPCDESPDDCSQNCCQWRMPAYSPSDPTFNISFNVSNKLGNAIFNHTFNNTDIVIPNPAEKVVIETAEESLEVRTEWVLPLYMETYAQAIGVLCVVEYRPSPHLYGGDTWLLGSFSTCRHKECNATVAVQHPGATYEFRVRLRARRENFTFDEDGWWSLWTAVEGNIPPQRPWNPPNLDIGTFQTNTGSEIGRRDVTVAWRPLPNLEHNGPDFSYVVNATADGKILSYSSITDTYVTFSDVSDEALVSLEVTSSNSMGHCNFSSHVDVYPKHLMPPLPVLPVVIHHPMTQQYELLWNGEESGEYTYTVYICTDDQDNKEACENNLYWIAVGNLTSVNVTLEDFGLSHLNDENIRFAVSEQSSKEGFSSGMSWDNCLSPQTYGMSSSAPDIGESIARNATAANLTWSLECKDRGAVVEAIIVEYCAGSHTFAMPCESPDNMTETEVFSGQIHLTQLEPGTTYSARFCLQYREGLSSWSEYSQFVTDKVPHPGMSAWLIVVISLSCIALSVLLVLCFTYSRGKIKDVLQDLNRDLNIPIGENAVGRHYSQGQETQGYISRKDYYEYFHSMEEVGLGKEDPETKLSDSDPSSTSSSPKFVKEGRSLTTGENAIPGTDEEEEKLLQGNSSSNTTTFDLKGSFINNQEIPKNTGYVQVNIPITVTNGNVPGSESSPHSHFSSSSTNGYVNPDSHFMSKSGYVAHDSGAAFMGYSTVSGDEHQESHELEVCKSLHYEAGNDESKNYVSSDHMNNSTTEEIAKVKEKVLLNSTCPNHSGYVQLEYTLDNQPLVLREQLNGSVSSAYVSIDSFTPMVEKAAGNIMPNMNTKHNQESKTNSNQNVLSHISNGYVDHSFALKDRETPPHETTNTVLLKGNAPNFAAFDGKPEYIQYPYPINDCDKIQAQSIHKVCPKQNESHGMSSDRNTYYAQNSLADENGYIGLPFEEKKYDINCEKDKVDKLETDIRISSRGYVAANCISDIKHMTDVTTSKEHYNIFPQNESKKDNDIEITPYSMNDFPHKADNSGYVKDKNINHMFEYDAASNAMSLNGNFSHSGVKNGYIAFPLDRIVEIAAGSTDSGISASVENISCFDSSEKEGSRSVANETGNNSNLVSNEKDMHSVTSNGLRIGYCRVGDA